MEKEMVEKSSGTGGNSDDKLLGWYRNRLRHLVQEEAPQIEEKMEQNIERLFKNNKTS